MDLVFDIFDCFWWVLVLAAGVAVKIKNRRRHG